jgi:cysteinyl-tRNA synthetase
MSRTVKIQDTCTGEERPLEPRDPGRVGIYACGPTVYAPVHVGNARPYVVFSLFKRFLEHEGYDVTFVANVTDVNDKIYDAAREAGVPSEQLAREMTDRYRRDTDGLGLGRPDAEPLASETIAPIVELIGDLIDSGHAYAAEGDVYFDVTTFPGYGKLSNRPLEEMQQGEDDATGLKRHAQDFALWKAHKEGEDTAWDAPWGRGRPGWHIECSAMAEQILGVDFDVHGGGSDLIFPHHENEIAQTEAARHQPLARLWMHNGMLQFGDEKMSKSVGNIRSLSGALEQYGRDALVMFFAQGHYRKPVEYSERTLDQASRAVDRVRELVRRLSDAGEPEAIAPYHERFFDSLADDFNTPAALAALFDWIGEANRRMDAGERVGAGERLGDMLHTLGLEDLLEESEAGADEEAQRLMEQREAARAAKDYAAADAARDRLAALGWQVRDTPQGPQLVPLQQ